MLCREQAKRRRCLVALPLVLACSMAQAEGFAFDLSWSELRKLEGTLVVDDLRVGEKGIIDAADFCVHDGFLQLPAYTMLSDEGEYLTRFEVTRLPGDLLRAEIKLDQAARAGEKPAARKAALDAEARQNFLSYNEIYPCNADVDAPAGLTEELSRLFRVQSINGYGSLSALIGGAN